MLCSGLLISHSGTLDEGPVELLPLTSPGTLPHSGAHSPCSATWFPVPAAFFPLLKPAVRDGFSVIYPVRQFKLACLNMAVWLKNERFYFLLKVFLEIYLEEIF